MWGCFVRLHHCTHGENQGSSIAGDEVENTVTRELGTKSNVDPETSCEADLSGDRLQTQDLTRSKGFLQRTPDSIVLASLPQGIPHLPNDRVDVSVRPDQFAGGLSWPGHR